MDINLGTASTVTLKVKNNSSTNKAIVKISLKNDAWSTSNGYKSGLKSAKINGNAVSDVSYGAKAEIAAGAEATFELVYDTSLPDCDKFVVSFNSEDPIADMPTSGNITISNCMKK